MGDAGKAVFDAGGVMHVASDTAYRTTCGEEWVALVFAWETRTSLHCRACILAAVDHPQPRTSDVV